MLRKSTFYALAVGAFMMCGGVSLWGELSYSAKTTRADAAVESSSNSVDDARVRFMTDVRAALALASRENKPTLIFFMADDCKYSRQMLAEAFHDSEVVRLAQSFVCVAVDMDDPNNSGVCRDYGVVASPTIQFVTSYGAPLQRVPSAQSGERLASYMESALAAVAWRAARVIETEKILR